MKKSNYSLFPRSKMEWICRYDIDESEDIMISNLKILKEEKKYRNPYIFLESEITIKKIEMDAKKVLKIIPYDEPIELEEFVTMVEKELE